LDPNKIAQELREEELRKQEPPKQEPPKLHVRLFVERNGDVSWMDMDSVALKKDHGSWLVGVTVYFVDDGWPEYRGMQPTSATCCGESQYHLSMSPKAVPLVYCFDCGNGSMGSNSLGGAYGINTRPIFSLQGMTLPSFIANYACAAGMEKLRQLGMLH
jgi:hypothetical protein